MKKSILIYLACLCVLVGVGPSLSQAQNPDTLMPEESAAKAKQIIKQYVDAVGGQAYLGIKERQCDGRSAQFDRLGNLAGYLGFHDYWKYPDRRRADYDRKSERGLSMILGDIIPEKTSKSSEVFVGDHGWSLDRGGVNDEPESAITEFQERVKEDVGNLLRTRLKEEGIVVRYAGTDIVDRKHIEWVEIDDGEQRTFRLAFDPATHLLTRSTVSTADENTRERNDEVTIYSNYQQQGGILAPLQIARERNERRTAQIFYNSCKFNGGIPDEIFTKASLEKRSAQIGVKKDAKDKE